MGEARTSERHQVADPVCDWNNRDGTKSEINDQPRRITSSENGEETLQKDVELFAFE